MRYMGVPGTAMGWLEGAYPFESGVTPSEVLEKIAELLSELPWAPGYSCGSHICDVGACQELVGKPQYEVWKGRRVQFGCTNLFIPGRDTIYIAPSTIIHYISAHAYRPSDAFCDALIKCPSMSSPAYFEAFRPALQISTEQEQAFSFWASTTFEMWSTVIEELRSNRKPFFKPMDRDLMRRLVNAWNTVFRDNHPEV